MWIQGVHTEIGKGSSLGAGGKSTVMSQLSVRWPAPPRHSARDGTHHWLLLLQRWSPGEELRPCELLCHGPLVLLHLLLL